MKVFDFGLAKELDPAKRDACGMFKLTENTGSARYIAPEVALGQPYNEFADVYSFSTLLWQILELDTPYRGFDTMRMLEHKVYQGGHRPLCSPKWPKRIVDVLHRGWGPVSQRPSMKVVVETLRDELAFASIPS